jgi:hypothetical protein
MGNIKTKEKNNNKKNNTKKQSMKMALKQIEKRVRGMWHLFSIICILQSVSK